MKFCESRYRKCIKMNIFSTFNVIAIIIVLSAITFVFISNLVAGSENFAFAKPDNEKNNGILDIIRNALGNNEEKDDEKDNEDDERDEEHDDEKDDKIDKQEEVKTDYDYDYDFVAQNDDRIQNFNFAAAGDFSCSQNAKMTIRNMLDKKPELVLPLGDLAVEDNTANCWLDLISPFENKIQITFGYHDLNEGVAKIEQYKKVFGLEKLYYSFDYGRAHFIIMSTLSDTNVTSEQYKFIEKELKAASEMKTLIG